LPIGRDEILHLEQKLLLELACSLLGPFITKTPQMGGRLGAGKV
jgi:hypothetical protein